MGQWRKPEIDRVLQLCEKNYQVSQFDSLNLHLGAFGEEFSEQLLGDSEPENDKIAKALSDWCLVALVTGIRL